MWNNIISWIISFLTISALILFIFSYKEYTLSENIKDIDKNMELISLNKDITMAEQIHFAQVSCALSGDMQGYFGDVINLPPEEALKCNEINKVAVWQDENATFHFGAEK